MTTVHNINGERVAYTKGAMDVLMLRMKLVLDTNGVRYITENDLEEIRKANLAYSENGMRVLALAKKILKSDKPVTIEDDLYWHFRNDRPTQRGK